MDFDQKFLLIIDNHAQWHPKTPGVKNFVWVPNPSEKREKDLKKDLDTYSCNDTVFSTFIIIAWLAQHRYKTKTL